MIVDRKERLPGSEKCNLTTIEVLAYNAAITNPSSTLPTTYFSL